MSDPSTPHPRMTTLTLRQITTAELLSYLQYDRSPAAAPGSVIAAPAGTDLEGSAI